ncbi:MAG: hypothetical protein KUG77_03625 [Nannocystaceae bacterium]|nr:hypothetical protein [Nannocystaceae bacterium]
MAVLQTRLTCVEGTASCPGLLAMMALGAAYSYPMLACSDFVRAVVASGLLVRLASGCSEGGAEDSAAPNLMEVATSGDDGEASSGSSGDDVSEDGADVCLSASAVTPGAYFGSLQGKRSSGGGACGEGGPDVFFRVAVARRSDVRVSVAGDGFTPRVGVFGNDCAVRFEDSGLLCTSGVPGWVSDVPAGAELYVAVGASQAEVDASGDGAFMLDVQARDVLSVGDACSNEAWGRCEGGTTCAVPTGTLDPAVCASIPGDRCGNPIPIDVDRGATALSVEPGVVHTDAHRHTCGGDRVSERVYRLDLPVVSAEATLRIEGERISVLAARGPTCLTQEERACDTDLEGLTAIELGGPLPGTLYLFAELPEGGSELSPSIVRLLLEDE